MAASSTVDTADMAQTPPMRSFEFDLNLVGKVKTGINQFRGSVSLPLELISLPGRRGLDVKVAIAYSSTINRAATTWNVEAPTGILGLGWDMPFDMIVVSQEGSGSTSNNVYYLVEGGNANQLVKTSEDSSGRWYFQAKSFQFWDISYDPRQQSWQIIHEDGTVYRYGGLDTGVNAVQWGIGWGNFLGSSIQQPGQQQMPVAWNLVSITSSWQHSIRYTYAQVTAKVGNDGVLPWTRACYLASVTDSLGRTVRFQYGEKFGEENPSPQNIVEYRAWHPQQPNNAWQDKYETRYLQAVQVFSADGAALFGLQFGYDFINLGASSDSNYPLLWKRVLTSVFQAGADGSTLPALRFSYNSRNETNPGALQSITDPAGSVSSYSYKANAIYAPKNVTVASPLTNSTPGVWHGDDYVAFTYCQDQGSLALIVYSWNGQWISRTITATAMYTTKADPASVRVIASSSALVVTLRNSVANRDEVYLYQKDPTSFGNWLLVNQQPYLLNLKSGSKVASQFVAGNDFVLGYNKDYAGNVFQAWSYDWPSGRWLTPNVLPSASQAANADGVVLAARQNWWVVAYYVAAQQQVQYQCAYRNLSGGWQGGISWSTGKVNIVKEDGQLLLSLLGQATGVVATWVNSSSASAINYAVSAYQWDANFSILNGSQPASLSLSTPMLDQKPQLPLFQTVPVDAMIANCLGNLRNCGGAITSGNNANWLQYKLAAPPASARVNFAAGADVVVMCVNNAGRQTNTLLTYNPNLPAASCWQSSAAIAQNGISASISADFMTVGATIYSRILTGDWRQLDVSLSGMGAPETIQNRGPNYIAYQNNTGSNAVSYVVTLQNGKANPAQQLPGGAQKIAVPVSEASYGNLLAGSRFLVSYPSSASSFKAARSLNLYCLDGDTLAQYTFDYPVAWIRIDDPYDSSAAYCESFFYANSAQSQIAINSQTGLAQYPLVTVLQGVQLNATNPPEQQPEGRSEYYYSNGLSPQAGLSYPEGSIYNYQQILNGMLLGQKDYDSNNRLVASQLNYWNVSTSDQLSGKQLFGAFVRLVRSTSMKDGVVQDSYYTYDGRTGLPTEIAQSYTDTDGVSQLLRNSTLYAWQVPEYADLFTRQHDYSAVAMTSKSVAPKGSSHDSDWIFVNSQVTTWRNWQRENNGTVQLAALGVYQWTANGAENSRSRPDFDFALAAQPGWVQQNLVLSRTVSGLVSEQIDVNGVPSSFVYDNSDCYLLAKFPNGSLAGTEVSFCGFETYEAQQPWCLENGAQIVPVDNKQPVDAHTGLRCASLPPQGALSLSITPQRQSQAYVFSAWLKTPADYNPATGTARWQISVSGMPEAVLDFPVTLGQWRYVSHTIRLQQATVTPATISLRAVNGNPAVAVLVDDLRFTPQSCLLEVNVYDQRSWLITAQMGANGESSSKVYDCFGNAIASSNAAQQTQKFQHQYFSRKGNLDQFSPLDPNHNLVMNFAAGGELIRFTQGNSWQAVWQGANWQQSVTDKGVYLTQSADNLSATLQVQDSSLQQEYAVDLQVQALQAVNASMGLRFGTSLLLNWNAQSLAWELLDGNGHALLPAVSNSLFVLPDSAAASLNAGQIANLQPLFAHAGYLLPASSQVSPRAGGTGWTISAPDGAWFYYLQQSGEGRQGISVHQPGQHWTALLGKRALQFWVDGKLIFSYLACADFNGAASCFFGSRVAIASLGLGRAPQANVLFTDSRGIAVQSQAWAQDDAVVVSQSVADYLGRTAVRTKAAMIGYARNLPFAYCADFAQINWQTGIMTGLVADAYPDDGGFPYSREVYEKSALARTIEQGMPGAEFAVGAHTTRIQYGSVADTNGKAVWYRIQTTDANNHSYWEVINQLGQVFSKTSENGGTTLINANRFDAAGNPVLMYSPNHFTPPAHSIADDWIVRQEFDSAGRTTLLQSGNQGRTTFIYDTAGNLRFTQTPQGALEGNYLYFKYDQLNRPLEKGYLVDRWDGNALQAKANAEPGWPDNPPTWRTRYYFDGDDSTPNSLGRIVKVEVNQGDSGQTDVLENYEYDIFGNTTARSVACRDFAGISYITRYGFDNLGNTIFISYPQADNGSSGGNLKLNYRINRLNQIDALAENPAYDAALASFSYQPNGRPKGQVLQLPGGTPTTLHFNFNSPLWLTDIAANDAHGKSVFAENLTYTSGGYNQSGYYNGIIASSTSQFPDGIQAAPFQYSFNALGQMENAQEASHPEWSLGVSSPVSYDANGNFLSAPLGAQPRQFVYQHGSQMLRQIIDPGNQAVLAAYAYDANGNLTNSQTQASPFARAHQLQFSYDPGSGITTSATDTAEQGAQLSFLYDSYQRRIMKTVRHADGSVTQKLYLHGMNTLPLSEITQSKGGAQTAVQHYLYGPGGVLAVRNSAMTLGVLKDHLGSVRALFDQAGQLQARYDYLPFGALARASGAMAAVMPYLFTGQEYDAEIELYNYRARLYAPETGRFISIDPMHQFFSPYLYAANNPVLYIDPTGKFSIGSFFSAIGGLIIGVIEVLIGVVIDVVAGVLEVVTGGLSTGASIGLAAAAGAFYGAGTGSISYSVFHFDNFSWKDYGIQMGIGALAGAISFGFGAAASIAAEAATGVAALAEAGQQVSTWARLANYAIETSVTVAGNAAANSISQTLNDLASGTTPGADVGYAVLWGAVADVTGTAFKTEYKAGWGNLGKRVLGEVVKAEVIGVASTLAQNAISGNDMQEGLVQAMFASALSGSLGGLKAQDAAKQSMKTFQAELASIQFSF